MDFVAYYGTSFEPKVEFISMITGWNFYTDIWIFYYE